MIAAVVNLCWHLFSRTDTCGHGVHFLLPNAIGVFRSRADVVILLRTEVSEAGLTLQTAGRQRLLMPGEAKGESIEEATAPTTHVSTKATACTAFSFAKGHRK